MSRPNQEKIKIDKSLDKLGDKVLFPKKLALANRQLKGVVLPDFKEEKK